MARAPDKPLSSGLYESLLTEALSKQVAVVHDAGGQTEVEALDPSDSHELLAQHLHQAIRGCQATVTLDPLTTLKLTPS